MKISLINVQEIRGDETPCFNAIIVVDGNPVLHVDNNGCGGSNGYHLVRPKGKSDEAFSDGYRKRFDDTYRTLDEAAKAFLKAEGNEHWDFESLDTIVYRLLDKRAARKSNLRRLKAAEKAGRVWFRKPGDSPDVLSYFNFGNRLVGDAERREFVLKKYPGATFLADEVKDSEDCSIDLAPGTTFLPANEKHETATITRIEIA